ncbi:hypothetical protein [Endothiovibrio diazotrophicus]
MHSTLIPPLVGAIYRIVDPLVEQAAEQLCTCEHFDTEAPITTTDPDSHDPRCAYRQWMQTSELEACADELTIDRAEDGVVVMGVEHFSAEEAIRIAACLLSAALTYVEE